MRGRGWDLGFLTGAWGPVVVLVAAAVLVLEVRRRWRLSVARGEEVRRMARAAAMEAERAEMEAAALAYVVPEPAFVAPTPVSGGEKVGRPALPPECALCGTQTTKVCAGCKAVRYCSGKCQIIHWRQGHKDECHPPRIDQQDNAQDSVSNLKGIQTEGSELCDNSSEIEGKSQTKPVDILLERVSSESKLSSDLFSADGNQDVKPHVGTAETDSASDFVAGSSSSQSSCYTFSGPLGPSGDVSASEDQRLLQNAKVGEAASHDISHDGSRTPINATETNPTEVLPTEFASARLPVNNLSCTSDLQQKASSGKTEDIGSKSNGLDGSRFISSEGCTNGMPSDDADECEGDCIQLDAGPSSPIPSKLSGHAIPSKTNSANENSTYRTASSEGTGSNVMDLTSLRFDKSGPDASGMSDNKWSLKSRMLGSLSSFSSVDHESPSGERHSVLHDSSSKIDNAPKFPTKLSENTGLVPNGLNDLKSSVKRVYQQIKSAQTLRHYTSLSGNDISQKYKMLFPYDLFVKLYNCDKVELRPCGLTNCGNSCYANAVLQCLAFTRPLTSYLLQGFHSKTCLKKDWCFTCEFETLLLKAKQGQSPLSPIGILSHIHKIGSNLGHGREEDAHEFLRYSIDTMQSMCLKEAGANAIGTLAEETTLIQLIFGGYLRSKIKCTRCQGKSERNERMMDLTVEIHGDIATLEEALARFTATEILDEENKYQCNRCKSYERAKKKLTVLEAPNVLTIILKRFQSGKFGKLNKAVRFPVHLNLAPYMSGTDDKSPVYSLYAVVVHQDIMNASFSGHYVCYVKSAQGKWYKTDDSKVKPVELEKVLKENAYMLLYARCSPRAPSLIRSTINHHLKGNKNRYRKALLAGRVGVNSTSMANPGQVEQQRSQGHHPPYRPSDHHPASFQPSDLFDGRFHIPKVDSSSDSSSLLSCSDDGSCSTESSTRDSTSTDYSEYLFGDSGRFSSNSPLGKYFEDSDGFSQSPFFSGHSLEAVSNGEALSYGEDTGVWERREVGLEGKGRNPLFLYSDTSSQFRKLTEEYSRDREGERVGGGVGLNEVKSGVTMRRSFTTRERTGQTLY